ncbi:MAG: 50S ribosomal protein L13 [Myxococcales bacterium]|nr:50S ribosomal protein L13 [Myxococcales bacterium]
MARPHRTTLLTHEQALDQRKWYVADVAGKTLGRAATTIAHVLRGKHKPTFTPNVDMGDFVVVINADKIKLTGNKMDGKLYYDHTLYPGGIKAVPAKKMLVRHPEELIKRAVWGMLPKGPLGRRLYKKLKVYTTATHEHAAQQPEPLALD